MLKVILISASISLPAFQKLRYERQHHHHTRHTLQAVSKSASRHRNTARCTSLGEEDWRTVGLYHTLHPSKVGKIRNERFLWWK